MVMEVVQEDMGDGSMQCTDHPYKNSTPGGICAFCLQEKLGKLVSSSFPVAIFPSSSSTSSSPPSLRSEFGTGGLGASMMNPSSSSSSSSALALRPSHHNVSSSSSSFNHVVGGNRINDCDFSTTNNGQYYSRRSKMPFLLSQRRKKKKDYNQHAAMGMGGASSDASTTSSSIVFKRSKSTTTPRRIGGIHNFLEEEEEDDGYANDDMADDFSPHKNKGFWSFLYSSKHSASKKGSTNQRDFINYPSSLSSASGIGGIGMGNVNGGTSMRARDSKKREELVVVDENESPDQAELDRKVSRSRSVGCGSRSFSGDFFERISTGFGDCTLRRVESQREGNKPKLSSMHRNSTGTGGQDCIKERVKCGGIFGGFMITSSSASSSSSSSYWVSSSAEDSKSVSTPGGHNVRHLAHGRNKSWGWALASPMRAFSKPSSHGKRESSSKNSTPNLSAIPSLLTVGG